MAGTCTNAMIVPPSTPIPVALPPVGDGKIHIEASLPNDLGGSQFSTPQSEDEPASPCYSPLDIGFYPNKIASFPSPGWMAPRRETPMWYTLTRYDSELTFEEDEEHESVCGGTEEEKFYEADSEPEDEESEESEESESEIDGRSESGMKWMDEKKIEVPSKEVWSSEGEGTAVKSSSRLERCVRRCIETRSCPRGASKLAAREWDFPRY